MFRAMKFTITAFSLLIVSGSGSLWAVTNSLSIKEAAGVTTANYPIQIGRPFVAGEIANYPQALVNGTAVSTQADIKQRWSDGSVKHAILAFLIPNLSSGSTVTITFQNQSSGNNAALSAVQMLGSNFNFNAQIVLTNGTTATADARTMLSTGAFSAWTSGSIAQTIILADHSQTAVCNGHACSTYDIGTDANKSFRPIFHATFFPTINKVRVRYIGEIAQTESLQNLTYSLALTAGNTSPATVYTKPSWTHEMNARWTKEFWIGGAPPAIAINHNLAYIAQTKFIPNYDSSRVVSAGQIANICANWQSTPHDLGDPGNWQKAMGTGGARPDIGPYEDWVVQWLYTGDSCLQDKAFTNSQLAAQWRVHYREGKAGKPFLKTDAAGSSTGLGHVVSLNGRPTANLFPGNYGASTADQFLAVGPNVGSGWIYDPSHEPEPGSIIYALTGDFWYLEECWFWTSSAAIYDYVGAIQRGPTGAEGILDHNQTRQEAWELRTRANTAFVTPDGMPEVSYITAILSDGISAEEGVRNITATANNGNATWLWGRQFASNTDPTSGAMGFGNLGVAPLGQWQRGSHAFAQDDYGICSNYGAGTPCAANTTSEAASLFEADYMLYALGRTKELGYPAGALLTFLSKLYTNFLTDPTFNPYIMDNGRVPTVKANGQYFANMAELKTGYDPNWQATTSFGTAGDPDGYAAYAAAGVSYITGETNGQAAWSFMDTHFRAINTAQNDNPKWAIVPRTSTSVSAGSCDLNGDGVVNVLDVQASINQVLGLSACTGDLDGNGVCNIVDTQRVINATLGAACRLGP